MVEEEGETQALLFTMLQEQHDKQLATMATTNKANMDAMMEKMNAIVAAGGGRNKENTPPMAPPTTTGGGTAGGGDVAKKPKRKKKLCPNCKSFVYHSHDKCYELKANKDARYPGWKSIHTAE